jgi:hypothetical protein
MIFKKEAIEIYGFLLIFVYIKTYIMSIILGITLISVVIWISYELWRAPLYDEATMKIIRPTKTLKDLFKKKL